MMNNHVQQVESNFGNLNFLGIVSFDGTDCNRVTEFLVGGSEDMDLVDGIDVADHLCKCEKCIVIASKFSVARN